MKKHQSEWIVPEIDIDLSKIDLSGEDPEILERLVKATNPTVPPDLLKELFDYRCYEARSAFLRESGESSYKLTPSEEAKIHEAVMSDLQIECVIRSLAEKLGIEVSVEDEEKELLKERDSKKISVKQLRKYYASHPLEANEKYLSILGQKVLAELKAVRRGSAQ